MRILPHHPKIDFVRLRFITFGITLLMVGYSLLGLQKGWLNLGIDFRGGYMIEIRSSQTVDLAAMRHSLNALGLGEVSLQEVGHNQTDFLIKVVRPQNATDNAQQTTLTTIKNALGPNVSYRRTDMVGPKLGEEIMSEGFHAVLWAMLAMLVYVGFRFEWQFGVCAVLSLIHDCLSVVGMYALTGLEFNTTAIVAVLITAGYSINDTVVIYDRIRENLNIHPRMPLAQLLNASINETLSRTILTSSTTLLALLVLYFLGGEVIASYSLPIICGIAVGTYSSIFLAAPLLLYVGIKRSAFLPSPMDQQKASRS